MRGGIKLETVNLVEMRYNLAILVTSLFAVAGLIIPSHYQAEGAGFLVMGKNLKQGSAAAGECSSQPGNPQSHADCKSDTKASKVDLDRKGHKVKHSKSSR